MATTILVSALLTSDGTALFARRDAGAWELPTVPMARDEEPEEALVRLTREQLGIESGRSEFLDTYYERSEQGGAPLVRNVYCVEIRRGTPLPLPDGDYREFRWVDASDLDAIAAGEQLRGILHDHLAATGGSPALAGAPVFIVTGPAGAGKSSTARALCARFERAAHIEVDALRDMVISGIASPIPGVSDPLEAAEQSGLANANTVALARNFSAAGFTVVVDAVFESAAALDFVLEELLGTAEVHVITLLPDAETLERRDKGRAPEVQMGPRALELRRIIAGSDEMRGLRLDNSQMTVDETVAYILTHRANTRVR